MTHTAFFDLARQTAHAALNGSQQPSLGGKLLTHLKIIAKCFVGDAVVTVDAGTAEFLILAKTSASGAASLIDTTAVLNTSDPDEPQYEFEWNPADSIQLRAVLDAAADPTAPVELRYEFRFERSGQKGCIGGPIWFLNNFFRPETPAPEATLNSSWETLKSRLAAGENVTLTVNDVTKVITLSVPDFADGEDGREIELQASGTHLQWRYVGDGSWTNLVALSVITGPAGANGTNGSNGTNGTNGSSVEMQVTATHIQWRLVGAPTWTNLIALTAITGPAGSNGTNGTNGTNGSAGADGDDGREIELQASGTHIQWRYVGAGSWTNLIALTAITGPAGSNGTNGTNGTNGSAGADGDDGREIELQTTATHIQWRYVGEAEWTNLLALSAIAELVAPARVEVADLAARLALTGDDINVGDIIAEIGAAERSQIVCDGVAGQSLNGAFLLMGDADGTVGFWFRYACPEKVTINFSGTNGAQFVTGGAGKSLNLVSHSAAHYFWFNTGGESDPGGTGTAHEVAIGPSAVDTEITDAFIAALYGWSGAEFVVVGTSTTLTTITDVVPGAHSNSGNVDSSAVVTVVIQGTDAATEPAHGADRAIEVALSFDDTANEVAAALLAAAVADGAWLNDDSAAEEVNLIDAEIGVRDDVAYGTSGFTVSTLAQGAAVGGTYQLVNPARLSGNRDAFAVLTLDA